MPEHTTGYVEAGRVPGKPRLPRGSGRALSPAWVRLPSFLALIGCRRSVRCSWPRPGSIRRWTGSPWPGTSACARCASSSGHGRLLWHGHKRLITAAALTGAAVTASGACLRPGREHVRGGRGSATWSAACRRGQALLTCAAGRRIPAAGRARRAHVRDRRARAAICRAAPGGPPPAGPVTDRRGRRRRFRPPGAARRTTRSPRRAQSSGRSRLAGSAATRAGPPWPGCCRPT